MAQAGRADVHGHAICHVAIARAQVPESEASGVRAGPGVLVRRRPTAPGALRGQHHGGEPGGRSRPPHGGGRGARFPTRKRELAGRRVRAAPDRDGHGCTNAVVVPLSAVQFEEGTRKGFVMVAGDGRNSAQARSETRARLGRPRSRSNEGLSSGRSRHRRRRLRVGRTARQSRIAEDAKRMTAALGAVRRSARPGDGAGGAELRAGRIASSCFSCRSRSFRRPISRASSSWWTTASRRSTSRC